MSTSPDSLTRPEQAAAIGHARAFMKQELAKGRACTYCTHRTTGTAWGLHGCAVNPNRSFPACNVDGRAPSFTLDEEQLKLKGVIHG